MDVGDRVSFQFKPLLVRQGVRLWSVGANNRGVVGQARDFYPFFREDAHGELEEYEGATVYVPPGYFENSLQRLPVCYALDPENLFRPGRFGEWRVNETLDSFHIWSHVQRFLMVDRLVENLASAYRVRGGPLETAILGWGKNGVEALRTAWERPEVFGKVACFSGEFDEDFIQLLKSRPKPPLKVYLDSGIAGHADGFGRIREIRDLLVWKGFALHRDLVYYAFPEHEHNEAAWATRFSIPLQNFFGG